MLSKGIHVHSQSVQERGYNMLPHCYLVLKKVD